MQASFWKTVSVVGVIGIGSLVTLEVQNRLSHPDSVASTDAALEKLIGQSGEQSITAATTKSDFDLAMERSNAGIPGFVLTEPPVEDSFDPEGNFGGGPLPPQDFTPPVDTTVRAEQLAQGGNPFAQMQTPDRPVVAAQYQDSDLVSVKPVGFEKEPTFTEDATPTASPFPGIPEPQPMALRPTPNVADDAIADTPFPLFGGTTLADELPDMTPAAESRPAADHAVPAQKRTEPFLFFGEQTDTPTDTTSPSQTVQIQPSGTARFDDSEIPQLKPAPTKGQSRSLSNGAPMFDLPSEKQPFGGQPEPAAPTGRQNEPFPGLPESAQPNAVEADNAQRSFAEDLVPAPREPFSDSVPVETAPLTTPPGDDTALPFAEDLPFNGGLQTIPDLPDTSPLALPEPTFPRSDSTDSDTDNRYLNDRHPETRDGSLELPADRQANPFDTRPFPIPGQFEETPPLTTPSQPELNSRTFEAQPSTEPRRRPANDGVRRFPPQNSENDIRLVSAVMRPNIVLEKTAPENASVGSPLDYSILVRNEGDATAFDVVVEDEVSAGVKVNGARPQPDLDRTTGKLIWHFDTIKPGETRDIRVQVTPTGEGTLDGIASVRFKARVQATTVITAPKLRLQMQGPKEVRLGEEVSYRYVITNEGTGEARDVVLRTVLPNGGGFNHPQGRDLEYEIQSMRPGEQREITLSVVAGEPGEHQTNAELTASGGANDQAAWQTNVVGAQLQIVRRGPKRRYVGRSGVYENVVTNETNFDAIDAKVIEQVPEGMRFISADNGGRYSEASRSVTWNLDRIGAGQQILLQIELMPTSAGSRESTVTILENAGFRSDDYVSTTVVEDLHNVSADISQLDGPVALGETFGFTITIDNRGTADATDVELTIAVPDEIQVVGAGSAEVPAKLLAGNLVQYNIIVRIAPGRKQAFQVKMMGARPVSNGVVKASVRYRQMAEPLVVSESVTVYRDDI
ncbi:MAG: hypothetical protein ABGZ53_02070 [Fuerstiella sp.]